MNVERAPMYAPAPDGLPLPFLLAHRQGAVHVVQDGRCGPVARCSGEPASDWSATGTAYAADICHNSLPAVTALTAGIYAVRPDTDQPDTPALSAAWVVPTYPQAANA